jgi:hydroxypyruvate isomerase
VIRLAANLGFLFGEVDFLDRFGAASACGFTGVEYAFPYPYPPAELKARLQVHGLHQALFNAPPGDWENGERGIAALPGREDEFRRSVDTLLTYAHALGCARVHVMSGTVPTGVEAARCEAVLVENLRYAAPHAATAGVSLLLEPLNPLDNPGYVLTTVPQAARLLRQIDAPNVRLQYDLYHQQMHCGALVATLREHIDAVEHVQIAGVPGRNEPDAAQEMNAAHVFGVLDELGYGGWVGCEYRPRTTTQAGLGWAQPYGIASAPPRR